MFQMSPYLSLNVKKFVFFLICLFVILYLIVIDYELVSKSQDIKWSWTKKQTPWYSGNWCHDDKNDKINEHNSGAINTAISNRRSTGKKVLTYTLFGQPGTDWVDNVGFVASEALDSYFYRDWMIRVYHNTTLRDKSVRHLRYEHPNIVFCDTRKLPDHLDASKYRTVFDWKMHVIGDPTVDVTCFRDLSSPLLQRELDAMEDWVKRGRVFHVLRDHPAYDKLINEGLFCVNARLDRKLVARVQRLSRARSAPVAVSQSTFENNVWDVVRANVTQHDSYRCHSDDYRMAHAPFPSERGKRSEYVGCKRPCLTDEVPTCPVECRPRDHQDWDYC